MKSSIILLSYLSVVNVIGDKMRKCLALISGFLFFLSSCASNMIIKENEKYVLSEIIEYSSANEILSTWVFFYNNEGNIVRSVFSCEDERINFNGMEYDENNNCIEYFQDNPYILYKSAGGQP